MIVVVGAPGIRLDEETGRGVPAGLAARIALAAAGAGAGVQLAGKVGDDPAGDEVLLGLARAGVRHDAMLRDPDRATPLAVIVPSDPFTVEPAVLEARGMPVQLDRAPASTSPAGAAPTPALDADDLALCLSYLRDFSVIVVAEPLDPPGMAAAGAAAAFAGADLVVIASADGAELEAPPGATVLEAPDDDPDDEFARLVARFAVSLELGVAPADAFTLALSGAGWEQVAGS